MPGPTAEELYDLACTINCSIGMQLTSEVHDDTGAYLDTETVILTDDQKRLVVRALEIWASIKEDINE